MKRILICGNYGDGKPTSSGQVIKTRIVTEEIVNHFGHYKCYILSTAKAFLSLLKVYLYVVPTMFRFSDVVMFPAYKGVLMLTPAFWIGKKLYNVRLHYVVIGGWLPLYINRYPFLRYMLRYFNGIYVETKSMESQLLSFGYKNIQVLPNVKPLKIVSPHEFPTYSQPPFKFCTFSRVMEMKGIADAVNAVKIINNTAGRELCQLDIYGTVEDNAKEWFDILQRQFPSFISYKGTIEANHSTDAIKDYYMLLFPTHFFTEGIPGTIIDAYAAGLPVIASRWQSFADIISERETGFTYDFEDSEGLQSLITYCIEHPQLVNICREKCVIRAHNYLPQNALDVLIGNMI